ncbi:MAG: L-rhamnose/proton symporter RhaT [Candidatus Acidiferrales bacterium]
MTDTSLVLGFALILVGGIMEGSYSFPLKVNPKWSWENTWGAGSLMALLLVPWPLAFWTVPGLAQVYHQSSWSAIFWALLFGAGWGFGGVFFGLSLEMVGLSLGYSIILAIIAINGSLTPLLMNEPGKLITTGGLWFLAAMAVMILGIIVCAIAGKRKESAASGTPAAHSKQGSFRLGLILCIVAGVLSGLVNFALIYGTEITQNAQHSGADAMSAINALWALVFTSNYLANVGYCLYLLLRNGTAAKLFEKGTGSYWLRAIVMGVLWSGGIVVYGVGAYKLGRYGAFIGFPALLAAAILTGNIVGWLSGEWKSANAGALRAMYAGIGLLLVAIVFLANANRLMSQ